MRDETGRQVGAVTNAVLVLLLAVVPLATRGAEVDHTQVRPWGCRTCPIPAPAPAPPADPGLGPVVPPAADAVG